ncbi:radical SAM protein [Streptomyces xiaopingdaonensis]|uniref:radical SAM protein n=1 Tax=Streptomyces xiaopingdaonensis TaxID=1565415 RepID=UPI00037C8302|nr:radical SAM protein [Streptomyces xiaopingdaonensis]
MLEHRALKRLDAAVPVRVSVDRTLRVKVIDACGMTCTFCHNEGTPVSADNRPGRPFTGTGPSGRTSLYLAGNGARFLSAPIHPDPAFAAALSQLRDALGFDEVHLTGGEPTLHPELPQLVRLARQAGYRVSVTSNGENGARALPTCAEAGLGHVNFSIFGTTPEELAQVQATRLRSPHLAARKIAALEKSLQVSLNMDLGTRANVVLPDADHIDRVRRLLERYSPQLSVRVLSSLADGEASLDAIDQLLEEVGAAPAEVRLIAGTSGFRIRYRLPDGRPLVVKHIRPLRLPDTCTGCRFNNSVDCEEGYYGVRLYRDTDGTFHVGVCIQRMDLCLPVEEFVTSDLCGEVRRIREQDHHDLTT